VGELVPPRPPPLLGAEAALWHQGLAAAVAGGVEDADDDHCLRDVVRHTALAQGAAQARMKVETRYLQPRKGAGFEQPGADLGQDAACDIGLRLAPQAGRDAGDLSLGDSCQKEEEDRRMPWASMRSRSKGHCAGSWHIVDSLGGGDPGIGCALLPLGEPRLNHSPPARDWLLGSRPL
jgi:hypothetical protein